MKAKSFSISNEKDREDFLMIGDNPISDVKAANDFGIDARLKDKNLREIVKDLI